MTTGARSGCTCSVTRTGTASPGHLDDAVKLIEEACGERVALTERHSDLTYWTAHLREGD